MTDDVHIRLMTRDDVSEIIVIENEIHEDPWTDLVFFKCLSFGNECWVLVSENKIIGYGLSILLYDECHIINLGICIEKQKRGYGALVLDHLLTGAKEAGMKSVLLEVRVTNFQAIMLYRAKGFVQIGRRDNYYPTLNGREDALVYQLKI